MNDTEITSLQKDLIIGSMLEDGMLSKNYNLNWNSCFVENHCLEQEEYLRFKGNVLGQHLSDIKYNNCVIPKIIGNTIQKNAGAMKKRIVLRSKCHPFLQKKKRGGIKEMFLAIIY